MRKPSVLFILAILALLCGCRPAPVTVAVPVPVADSAPSGSFVFQPRTASSSPIYVDQGATCVVVFTWYQADGVTPVNLSGYSATFHVLQTAAAGGALLDWSSYCVLGGSAGTVTLTVPATVTTTYSVANFGYFNLLLTAGDGVTKTRVFQGNVVVNPSVG